MIPAAMATVTVVSSNPSFSHTFFTLDDNLPATGRPREASFSYLSTADDSFSLRLSGEFNDHQNTASIPVNVGSSRKKMAATQDDELDVFGAEKYFSGGMDVGEVVMKPETPWKASPLKESELTGRKTRPGTPSVSSEASGNSRSVLLRDARRDRLTNPPRPHPGSRKFLGIFLCSCSDGSPVEVDKNIKGTDGGGNPAGLPLGAKQTRPELWCSEENLWRKTDRSGGAGFTSKREDFFTFPPVLKPVVVANSTVRVKAFQEDQKMARISPMDVFGTPFLGKEEVANSLRRSLAIMNPFAPRTGGCATAAKDDGACSESSSELFEIESFSTGTVPFGGAGGTSASTTGYEPSEASIEWSVVTASAANFSVGSDGEVSPPKGRRTYGKQQNQRPSSGLLLGCGSAKAVNVAPSNNHRAQEKAQAGGQRQRHKSMDAIIPETRYRAESPRSVDFGHGRAGHVLAARGIPRPISTHVPHLQHPH